MTALTDGQIALGILFIGLISLSVIYYMGLELSENNGSDIRVIFFLFSFSAVCTMIISLWAVSTGAIDKDGDFHGRFGTLIHRSLIFMLDINSSIAIFSALLAIVIVPQSASYILSGLFGCASDPIFVGKALKFYVWGIVKSLVTASGILLPIALYGAINGWVSWSIKGAASMSLLSVLLLLLSFTMIYLYRGIIRSTADKPISKPNKLLSWITKLQTWMTRKSSKRVANYQW